jgi:hypothetical protein
MVGVAAAMNNAKESKPAGIPRGAGLVSIGVTTSPPRNPPEGGGAPEQPQGGLDVSLRNGRDAEGALTVGRPRSCNDRLLPERGPPYATGPGNTS